MDIDLHPGVGLSRFDPDSWDDIYVVGDVHGCADSLDRLLAVLSVTDDDLVVFVGDLVRKGPDSRGVVDRVRGMENAASVRGNNEQKLLDGEATVPSLREDDIEWLRSLPTAVRIGGNLVVHGGIDPRRPLEEQSAAELRTTRSLSPAGGYERPLWYEGYEGPPRVFFGHTVHEEPIDTGWAVALDTGCVYGGALTAYDLRGGEFHSVAAPRPGRSRSNGKIVSPFPAAE